MKTVERTKLILTARVNGIELDLDNRQWVLTSEIAQTLRDAGHDVQAAAELYDLPELTGVSDKQLAYGAYRRELTIDTLYTRWSDGAHWSDVEPVLLDMIATRTDAAWWLDNDAPDAALGAHHESMAA